MVAGWRRYDLLADICLRGARSISIVIAIHDEPTLADLEITVQLDEGVTKKDLKIAFAQEKISVKVGIRRTP